MHLWTVGRKLSQGVGRSGRRLTYVWRSRAQRVQCNIEEVKVFESLRELRVDPDLDAPAPPSPPRRRSNPSDVLLRALP